MLTAGSLFSGIGGIDLAFSLAGFDILYQVEINEFCRRVLTKHAQHYWRNAAHYTDVQQCGNGRAHPLPYVDALFGGFPCQDISDAGKRAGIREGTRSGLWYDFKRIIGDVRPRIVFLENVAAITRKDRGGTTVIAQLAQMGYVGFTGTLFAADAGAPHQRERWFAVGYLESAGSERNTRTMAAPASYPEEQDDGCKSGCAGQDVGNTGSGITQRNRQAWQQVPSMGHFSSQSEGGSGQVVERRNLYQSRMGGNLHGLSAGMDGFELMQHEFPAAKGATQYAFEPARTTSQRSEERLTALGNAVVPQVVYPIAKLLADVLRCSP